MLTSMSDEQVVEEVLEACIEQEFIGEKTASAAGFCLLSLRREGARFSAIDPAWWFEVLQRIVRLAESDAGDHSFHDLLCPSSDQGREMQDAFAEQWRYCIKQSEGDVPHPQRGELAMETPLVEAFVVSGLMLLEARGLQLARRVH